MSTIKRYPNRKLYDTEAKQYITLEGIAELIRRGEEIRVIDNATGEDLTALTLTQVIFELEKKQSGFLPRNVLSSLIQAGGDRISTLQRSLVSTIGFWHIVDEEIKRRVNALVKQGDLAEGEGQRLVDRLMALGHITPAGETDPKIQELHQEIDRALEERGIPTRGDLDHILQQLDNLAEKLDDLDQTQQK
jgi:polyhydroxyalkanoate synthesis repressor PhaR